MRQPLERLDPRHQSLDLWEYILYAMTLAFSFEGEISWAIALKVLRYDPISDLHKVIQKCCKNV